jgi:hypothetical protein
MSSYEPILEFSESDAIDDTFTFTLASYFLTVSGTEAASKLTHFYTFKTRLYGLIITVTVSSTVLLLFFINLHLIEKIRTKDLPLQTCPPFKAYNITDLKNLDYSEHCIDLSQFIITKSEFKIHLCMSPKVCGQGYVLIERFGEDGQKYCELKNNMKISSDTHYDSLIKTKYGPDFFYLVFSGPQRDAISDWQYLGNCSYKMPFRLVNAGNYTVDLIHGYDSFNAFTEKPDIPLYNNLLQNYFLDICTSTCPTLTPLMIDNDPSSSTLPVCSKYTSVQGAYIHMSANESTMNSREQIQKPHHPQHPYVWYPLNCRYHQDDLFALGPETDNRTYFDSKRRRIMFLGDSQLRYASDMLDRRLSGHIDIPVQKIHSFQYKIQKYSQEISEVTWDVMSEESFTDLHPIWLERSSNDTLIQYKWDTFMKNFADYQFSRGFDETSESAYADREFDAIDTLFFGFGHHPGAGVGGLGRWTLKRFIHYLDFLVDSIEDISHHRVSKGLEPLYVVWTGIVSIKMQNPEGLDDVRKPGTLKLWSDAANNAIREREWIDVIDSNAMTLPWIQDFPDGIHPFETPALDAMVDEILGKIGFCSQ